MNGSLMFLFSDYFGISKKDYSEFVNVSDGGDDMKSVIYLSCG